MNLSYDPVEPYVLLEILYRVWVHIDSVDCRSLMVFGDLYRERPDPCEQVNDDVAFLHQGCDSAVFERKSRRKECFGHVYMVLASVFFMDGVGPRLTCHDAEFSQTVGSAYRARLGEDRAHLSVRFQDCLADRSFVRVKLWGKFDYGYVPDEVYGAGQAGQQ